MYMYIIFIKDLLKNGEDNGIAIIFIWKARHTNYVAKQNTLCKMTSTLQEMEFGVKFDNTIR